jgi:hypothetical protein
VAVCLHICMSVDRRASKYGLLLFSAFFCGTAVHAQEFKFTEVPAPKVEKTQAVHHSWYSLDKTTVALGLVQAGAELFDGVQTRKYVTARYCWDCTEGDPVSRLVLGPRPTWQGMIFSGSLEGIASTYLHQTMRRSRHRFIRWLSPAAPLTLTVLHIQAGHALMTNATNSCAYLGLGYYPVAFYYPASVPDGFTCVKGVNTTRPTNVGPVRRPRLF